MDFTLHSTCSLNSNKVMKKILNLVHSINFLLVHNKLIKPNENILIAISAGQDSTSILFLFYILKNQWKIKIFLFYCNHFWQKDSFYTFLHLSKITFSLNLNFSYSLALTKQTSEQNARNWRLTNYFRFIKFFNSKTVLTGHTESDAIETFLFNLFRGSSVSGLSSLKLKKSRKIKKNDFLLSKKNLSFFQKLKKKQEKIFLVYPIILKKKEKYKEKFSKKIQFRKKNLFCLKQKNKKNFFIVRPLFTKSRLDIEKICTNWKLPVFPDKTNEDFIYTRNRIRKQLLPSLRFFFNPKIDLIISRSNNILIAEEVVIDKLVKNLFSEIVLEDKKFYSINLALFYSFPLGLQRKIVFLFLTKKLSIYCNFYTINLFISTINNTFLQKKTSKVFEEVYASSSCNWIFFPQIGIIFFYKNIIIFLK